MEVGRSEFSLRDMVLYCLLHWRSALVIVLVAALVGGTLGVVRSQDSSNAATSADGTQKQTQEQTQAASSNDESQKLLEWRQSSLEVAMTYKEKSLLMRIDPNKKYVARAIMEVSVSKGLPTGTLKELVLAYTDAVRGTVDFTDIAKEFDTDPVYVREIMSIGDSSGAVVAQDQVESPSTDVVTTVSLSGFGVDGAQAAAVCDALVEAFEDSYETVAASVAPHTIRLVSRTAFVSLDRDLVSSQTEAASAVSSAMSAVADAKSKVTTDGGTATNADAGTESNSGGGSPTPSKGRMVLAIEGGANTAVVAVLAYGLVLCLHYLLGKAPLTRSQVATRYGLPEISAYGFGDLKLYRDTTRLDRWLRGLAGLGDAPEVEDVAAMAAANVRLYADDARKVLVTSSVGSVRSLELAGSLETSLEGFVVTHADFLASRPAAREALKAADTVILVEEYGRSSFVEIDRELELVMGAGKKPLGIVMA